jgi:integrase
MAGKQAKVLSDSNVRALLTYARKTRNAARNRALVLLSVKAGLRAGEIAKLTWEMVLDPNGRVSDTIAIVDDIAKKGSGRTIPINEELKSALVALRSRTSGVGPVIRSERDRAMIPISVINWFAIAYRAVRLDGCSSHSGRRTFITRAAKAVHRVGGSLRDVQMLAGHKSVEMTQRYIDADGSAQRRLVNLI